MKKLSFVKSLGYKFEYIEGEFPRLAWEQGTIFGDSNLDEKVSLADAVLLQKYLLADAELEDKGSHQSDLDYSKTLTAVDLTLLKRMLINS